MRVRGLFRQPSRMLEICSVLPMVDKLWVGAWRMANLYGHLELFDVIMAELLPQYVYFTFHIVLNQ